MELSPLEQHVLSVLNISEEQYKQEAQDHADKSTTKRDLNNLGSTVVSVLIDNNNLGSTIVDLLIKLDGLEQRIIQLEGGAANA